VVATINGQKITQGNFDERSRAQLAQIDEQSTTPERAWRT
jgi:hypothetical protein